MTRLSRTALWLMFAAVGATALHDVGREPREQIATRVALAGIHIYQSTIAPAMAAAGLQCRFVPSCSHYAEQVVINRGVVRGSWRTIGRVLRCGPWTPIGTVDPP